MYCIGNFLQTIAGRGARDAEGGAGDAVAGIIDFHSNGQGDWETGGQGEGGF